MEDQPVPDDSNATSSPAQRQGEGNYANELELLYRAALTITSQLNIKDLVGVLVPLTEDLIHGHSLAFFEYDAKTKFLHATDLIYGEAQPSTLHFRDFTPIPVGQRKGLIGLVAQTRQPLVLDGVRNEPDFINTNSQTRSYIAVPVVFGPRLLGVLTAVSYEPAAFDKQKVRLFTAIAAQVAVALENARLYEAVQKRQLWLAAANKLGQTLTQTLDLNKVLESLLSEVIQIAECNSANVQIIDGDKVVVLAHRGYSLMEGVRELVFDTKTHPSYQEMLVTQEPVLISDTRVDSRWINSPATAEILSWAGIPLIASGDIIGILNLDSRFPNTFKPETVDTLRLLADFAAIAINNARMVEKMVLMERMAAVGEMAAVVRHEINNPLTVILGNVQWLLRMSPELSEDARACLQEMEVHSQRIAQIVGKLSRK